VYRQKINIYCEVIIAPSVTPLSTRRQMQALIFCRAIDPTAQCTLHWTTKGLLLCPSTNCGAQQISGISDRIDRGAEFHYTAAASRIGIPDSLGDFQHLVRAAPREHSQSPGFKRSIVYVISVLWWMTIMRVVLHCWQCSDCMYRDEAIMQATVQTWLFGDCNISFH
jgi:hypothetical protein